MSPLLFNVYIRETIKEMKHMSEIVIKVYAEGTPLLRFADYIVLLVEIKVKLRNVLKAMHTFE